MVAFEGYAELADIYALGLAPQAFTASPRVLSEVTPGTGVLTLRGNGLALDAPLRFIVLSTSIPGEAAAALPGGLDTSVLYDAKPVDGSSDLLRVAPHGGAAIASFTSAGVGVFGIVVDPIPTLRRLIRSTAGWLHAHMPAYATPIDRDDDDNYPEILIQLNARFAAREALIVFGLQNPQYEAAAKAVNDRAGVDQALLIDWKKGLPIPGVTRDQTPTASEMGAVSWSSRTDGGGDPDWHNVAGGGYL